MTIEDRLSAKSVLTVAGSDFDRLRGGAVASESCAIASSDIYTTPLKPHP